MRPAAIAALVVAVLVAVGTLGPARAQVFDPGPTTTTTAPPESTTTTTAPAEHPAARAPTTTTTEPPPPPSEPPPDARPRGTAVGRGWR